MVGGAMGGARGGREESRSLTTWSHRTVDTIRDESGRNGVEGKKSFLDGTEELLEFLLVYRSKKEFL